MSNKRRDRANQLVVEEVSVDFTKHTKLISAHKHEQKQCKRDNCNRHSQVLKRSQLSNKGRDRAVQLVVVEVSVKFTKHILTLSAHEHEQETAQPLSLVLQGRHRTIGVAANNTSVAIEILCLASRRLPTAETSQRLVQRSRFGRVHRLSRNSDEPAAGGYLYGKEIQHPSLAVEVQKKTE